MKKVTSLMILLTATLINFSSCKQAQSDNITTLTTANFTEETAKGIVMVDFWASWCMPCKAMAPVIDKIATQTKGKVKVGKVDVDANGELANKFGIQAIPTIIIFKDGQQVETLVGMQSKESLVNALSKHVTLE